MAQRGKPRLSDSELWSDFEIRLQDAEGTSFQDLREVIEQADWQEICRELGYTALRTARLLKLIQAQVNRVSGEESPAETDPESEVSISSSTFPAAEGLAGEAPLRPGEPDPGPDPAIRSVVEGQERDAPTPEQRPAVHYDSPPEVVLDEEEDDDEEEGEQLHPNTADPEPSSAQVNPVNLVSFSWLPRPELIANDLHHVIVDDDFVEPVHDSDDGSRTPRAEDLVEDELNAYSDYGHLAVHNDDFHRMNQESWRRLLERHSISHPSVVGESANEVATAGAFGEPGTPPKDSFQASDDGITGSLSAKYRQKIRSRLRFNRFRPGRSYLVNQGIPEGPRMANLHRDFLVQGARVTKHGRKGSPRERHLSVSSDLRVIMWGKGAQHQIPTHLMRLITSGCATWVLERSRPKGDREARIWEEKCFSLVFTAGTECIIVGLGV